MTNDPLYHRLRELSWRRKLTDSEEAELRAWLAAHPEAQAGWEVEAELNQALGRLPDAPVSSKRIFCTELPLKVTASWFLAPK